MKDSCVLKDLAEPQFELIFTSSRTISLSFVKLGKQFYIHACIYLMNVSFVNQSHVTHIHLVMGKMFKENDKYIY